VEEKKGRFTLKRSKSKKKQHGLEHSHDISDPLGYIPTASVANANHGQPSSSVRLQLGSSQRAGVISQPLGVMGAAISQ
jgi:hypothetical protein